MLNTDGSVGVIADWAAAKGKKCTLVDYRWDIEKQVMEVLLECLQDSIRSPWVRLNKKEVVMYVEKQIDLLDLRRRSYTSHSGLGLPRGSKVNKYG